MDEVDERVKEFLEDPVWQPMNSMFKLARLSMSDWEEIKKTPTEELITSYIDLKVTMHFCVSVCNIQERDLMEIALESRGNIDWEEISRKVADRIAIAKKNSDYSS